MKSEAVVLLHGLGRTSLSMVPLRIALERDGYLVVNRSYPSTRRSIERLTAAVRDGIGECRRHDAAAIHFVTHSMGGILLRMFFQDEIVPEARRAVMLAPPNRGSEIVDAYRQRWWFRWATGPAGQQLGTGRDGLPRRLQRELPLEVGVIAGVRSSDPWFGSLFAADHDGKVSVQSAALPEMRDMLTVDAGHTFMMNSPQVIRQVKAFLRSGQFDRPPA